MAKYVEVALREDTIWEKIEVPNFYDPEKHHTIRMPGSTEKVKYYAMKFPDGRIYNKEEKKWHQQAPEDENIVLQADVKLPLEYGERTIGNVLVENLHRCPNLVEFVREIARVLQDKGVVYSNSPMAGTTAFYKDPYSKCFFNKQTFDHFAPCGEEPLFRQCVAVAVGEYIQLRMRK